MSEGGRLADEKPVDVFLGSQYHNPNTMRGMIYLAADCWKLESEPRVATRMAW
jgi:hypothetical protein